MKDRLNLKKINQDPIILASRSPRRKQLLENIGLDLKTVPSAIDEDGIGPKEPELYVQELAELKARDISTRYPDAWVLGADTIVVIDGDILGKPADEKDAFNMLSCLSGRDHFVYTGFCITHKNKAQTVIQSVKTRVRFKPLSKSEILWYLNTGEPFDKAGSYGIQDVGSFMVREVCGSYTNVVGLPVTEVVEAFEKLGIIQFLSARKRG